MNPPLVLVSDDGPVRNLSLNRPEKLNALSTGLVEALSKSLRDAAGDDEVRVVVISGEGRSFCAGYDLAEESVADTEGARSSLMGSLERLLEVFDHPKPVIAKVHGHCLAGGCDLMMMCDLALASDDAVFGQPEIKFGAAVVANVMPWLIGARKAKEYLLTGEDRITAAEAERLGLVNRVVERNDLDTETARLATRLSVVDPAVMRLAKRSVNTAWEAAGFRASLIAGIELGAAIESGRAPEREEFERIAAERGLADALRWRDSRFPG